MVVVTTSTSAKHQPSLDPLFLARKLASSLRVGYVICYTGPGSFVHGSTDWSSPWFSQGQGGIDERVLSLHFPTFYHLAPTENVVCIDTLHATFMHHVLQQCLSEHYSEWCGIV
jgi:hypothetical protein